MTLSGGRQFNFEDVSELVARLPFLIKSNTSLTKNRSK